MSLEENIQHDVMNAIQLLMSSQSESIMANRMKGFSSANGIAEDSEDENQHVIDRQLKEAWDEVHRLTMENEELSQKYHDIQMKVSLISLHINVRRYEITSSTTCFAVGSVASYVSYASNTDYLFPRWEH